MTEQRTTPMTALAFVEEQERLPLRLMLAGGGLLPSVELHALNFIHAAAWGLVGEAGGDWDGHLLFISNFNGDTDEYIANFANVLETRVEQAFGRCRGFPGVRPSSGFIAYVAAHSHPSAVYHCAYPDATSRDVAAALRAGEALDRLRERSVTASPREFRRDYEEMLDRLARRDPPATGRLRQLDLIYRGLRHPSRWSSVSAIFRIEPDRVGQLAAALDAVNATDPSPFDAVSGTHFARIVLLGRPDGGRPDGGTSDDRPEYLLFSAQVDGDPSNYVHRLQAGSDGPLLEVWRSCAGFPDVADDERHDDEEPGVDMPAGDPAPRSARAERQEQLFVEWFELALVPALLLVAASGRSDVTTIRSALERHRRFDEFVAAHQDDDPDLLLSEFQRAWS